MIDNIRLVTLGLAASLAGTALAQDLTIQNGNMRYRNGAPSPTSQAAPSCDLRADALNTNHMFANGWYFRVAGDTQETSFRAVGPLVRAVATADHADSDWSNVESRGLFSAMMDFDCYAAGPASGVVINRLTITNTSGSPLTMDLFNYADLDLCDSSSGDSATGGTSSILVTDPCGVVVEYRALGNDLVEVQDYSATNPLRTRLTDTSVNNLQGWSGTFGPGDFTAAYQWQNRTFAAGQARTFTVLFAVDTRAQYPPINEHYGSGLAGQTGVPRITTDALPLQNNAALRSLNVLLTNARPNSPCALLSNANSASMPFLNVFVWVDPSSPAQVVIQTTNSSGFAAVAFLIPTSPYLTGFPIYHQWFVGDTAASNGIASYTTGLSNRVGKL
jgi:hypothetical protein